MGSPPPDLAELYARRSLQSEAIDAGQQEGHISTLLEVRSAPRLSIVIPSYNEARRLPGTLTRLCAYLDTQSYRSEILIVVNGSTDGTIEVAHAAARTDSRLRVLTLDARGKGRAVRAGALAAEGEIIFLCDADLSMPPERLAAFLEAVERSDVVVGSREVGEAHRYNEPWNRHLMGRVFNWLVQVVAVRGIEDTQCGFKALRREAAHDLFSQLTQLGWGFDVELLFLAQRYGYIIEELGIDWFFDSDTRVRAGVDTLQMLRELAAIRVNAARGHYRIAGKSAPRARDTQHV
jgi:glycosyltransferase involved in cell wall biosynthesis